MTATELLNKVLSIDIDAAAELSTEDSAPDLVKAQQDQLYAGLLSTGQPIVPLYRPTTIARKRGKGQPTDRVTLKDTGAYYKGIIVDVRGENIIITNADSKAGKLEDKYGPDILGLADNAKSEYVRNLLPVFIERIKSYLK